MTLVAANRLALYRVRNEEKHEEITVTTLEVIYANISCYLSHLSMSAEAL
jgi:hypothetical protein